MTTPTPTARLRQRPVAPAPISFWRSFRFTVLACVIALFVSLPFVGVRSGSWAELRAAVASGRASEVMVQGMSPEASQGTFTFRWRDESAQRWTRVWFWSSDGQANGAPKGTETVTTNPYLDLRAVAAKSGVEVSTSGTYETSGAEMAGWWLPAWAGPVILLAGLATLYLLVAGPEPWWATRWAWFWWLISPLAIVAVPAFLIASGSSPFVLQSSHPGRRLTGGWSFLLASIFAGGIAAAYGLTR